VRSEWLQHLGCLKTFTKEKKKIGGINFILLHKNIILIAPIGCFVNPKLI
jgi:hypothetical protein